MKRITRTMPSDYGVRTWADPSAAKARQKLEEFRIRMKVWEESQTFYSKEDYVEASQRIMSELE